MQFSKKNESLLKYILFMQSYLYEFMIKTDVIGTR